MPETEMKDGGGGVLVLVVDSGVVHVRLSVCGVRQCWWGRDKALGRGRSGIKSGMSERERRGKKPKERECEYQSERS